MTADQPSAPNWRRVHPASPIVKMWLVVLAVAFFVLRQFADSQLEGSDVEFADLARNTVAWAVVVGGAVLIIGGMYLSWHMTRFAISDDVLQVRSGIVFRKHATIRLERIEAIDIRRPLGARILGLAELQIETAGGEDSKVELGYFKLPDATQLRADLIAAKPHEQVDVTGVDMTGWPGPVPPGQSGEYVENAPGSMPLVDRDSDVEVVRIPTGRIIVMALIGPVAVSSYLIAIGVIAASFLTQTWGTLGILIPIGWGFAAHAFSSITSDGAYRAALNGTNMRVSRGLTDHTTQSVPVDRIHAIAVTQGIIARLFGWWTIEATIAGYDGEKSQRSLLPYAAPAQVAAFLAALNPYWQQPQSQHRLAAAMFGTRDDGAPFTATPAAARIWEPLAFARTGIMVDGNVAFIRQRRLGRSATVIWLDHCQSVTVSAGPLDRRAGVATITLDLVSGAVAPAIDHVAADQASAIRTLCLAAATGSDPTPQQGGPTHVSA